MKTKTYVHNLSRIAWAYVFLLIDFSMSVNDFMEKSIKRNT